MYLKRRETWDDGGGRGSLAVAVAGAEPSINNTARVNNKPHQRGHAKTHRARELTNLLFDPHYLIISERAFAVSYLLTLLHRK